MLSAKVKLHNFDRTLLYFLPLSYKLSDLFCRSSFFSGPRTPTLLPVTSLSPLLLLQLLAATRRNRLLFFWYSPNHGAASWLWSSRRTRPVAVVQGSHSYRFLSSCPLSWLVASYDLRKHHRGCPEYPDEAQVRRGSTSGCGLDSEGDSMVVASPRLVFSTRLLRGGVELALNVRYEGSWR
uniref:(northern house mosquito) hypothetical protein n=1 Tax=Culex pipiens TaxID=7175 RepID=A0A8D8BSI6_CULPI